MPDFVRSLCAGVLLIGVLCACQQPEPAESARAAAPLQSGAASDRSAAGPPSMPAVAGLSGAEMELEAPLDAFEGTPYATPEMGPPAEDFPEVEVKPPVTIKQAGTDLNLRVLSERGYDNADRQHVVDLLEGELAYLAVKVETAAGNPVSGARPTWRIEGSSRITEVSSAGLEAPSDDSGMVEFGVQAGRMGADELTITLGPVRQSVVLNVISLAAAGYPSLEGIEGALPWEQLLGATVRYTEDTLTAQFPAAIAQHHRQSVRLAGFMMPLEAEQKQKRFLLTSNPPNCFFHVPGGPAGAVEVFSDTGIEASWDPIVLEGRFETLPSSDSGVIYRLRGARQVPG